MNNRYKSSVRRTVTLNTAVDVWSRGLLGRIQATLSRQKSSRMKLIDAVGSGGGDLQSWEEVHPQSSAFALLGRRPRMEDRYIIEENINNNTGISFFAVFDGHGGEFAADFAKDILVRNIYKKIIETTKLLSNNQHPLPQKEQSSLQQPGKPNEKSDKGDDMEADYAEYDTNAYLKRKASRKDESNKENEPVVRRRDSFRKTHSATDDCNASSKQAGASSAGGSDAAQHKEPDAYMQKLNSLIRGSGFAAKESFLFYNNNNNKDGNSKPPPPLIEAKCYIENGKINFGKLITDEVLSADYKLVEAAKKTTNIAGTTALIAVIQGSKLIVANVGDSRGVMCNARGIAIPLSFDHKPQQVRERKRIHDAGGFIEFRGVWRVAGILATSRALGDYPLKDKNLVIANPDILTFDLTDHKPNFLILASDGLWDTFSNEEACSFIKDHINESDYGARALTMQSYQRGSIDNITVLVIVFKNGIYRIASSAISGTVTGAIPSKTAGGSSNSAPSPNKILD